jgi:hypothetical protein
MSGAGEQGFWSRAANYRAAHSATFLHTLTAESQAVANVVDPDLQHFAGSGAQPDLDPDTKYFLTSWKS